LAIQSYIKEVLLFYNSAVLPGFGAFEIEREPSEVVSGKVFPPKPKLVFNKENTLNDNILSAKIVEAEDISTEEAHQKIQEYIDKIRFSLNKKEAFEVEGIGKLWLDDDNNYRLEKDASLDLDFVNYGLAAFELESAEEEESKEDNTAAEMPKETTVKPEAREEEKPPSYTPARQNNNKGILYVLSGSVVVILSAFIILAFTTDLFDNNPGLESIFGSSDYVTEENQDYTDISEDEYEFDQMVSELEEDIDSATTMGNALDFTASEPVNEKSTTSYVEYHIIAGSFHSEDNAQKLSRTLSMEGFPCLVVNRGDGLYRVSAISFKDKETALKKLYEFRERKGMEKAWLLGLK